MQMVDCGFKFKVLGLFEGMVWEEVGFDLVYVQQWCEWEVKNYDFYFELDKIGVLFKSIVKVMFNNGCKGESVILVIN